MSGSGLVAQVVQVFSLRPASMRRMIRSWELAMWLGDEPRASRELVAAAVSRLNDCHY
jgi:alkylhydroperoxidase family enzyme